MQEMYAEIIQRQEELESRLDNLEPCRDNPVYEREIRDIRRRLEDIQCLLETDFF